MKEALLAFSRRDFIRNSFKLISGTTLAQLVMVLVSPLLSRLYSPENFGDLAIFNSILGIGVVFATLRLEMGIVVADSDDDAGHLFRAIKYVAIFFSIFSLIIVSLNFGPFQLFHPDKWHFLIPFGLLSSGLFMSGNYYRSRKKEFGIVAKGKIFQTFSNAIVSISTGFLGLGSIGLILGTFVGWTFGAYFYFPSLHLKEKKAVRYSLKKFGDFPRFSLPATFLDTASQHVPIFLFTHYFSISVTGHYSMAMKVLLLPISMVGNSVGQVFFEKLNGFMKSEPEKVKPSLLKLWGTLFLLGFVPLLLVFLFGTEIVIFVFGKEWELTGEIAETLSPMVLAMFISSPTSSGFIVLGIQKYQFYFTVVTLTYRIASLLIGAYYRDLLFGLQIWVVLEIVQIFFYNMIIWRKL